LVGWGTYEVGKRDGSGEGRGCIYLGISVVIASALEAGGTWRQKGELESGAKRMIGTLP